MSDVFSETPEETSFFESQGSAPVEQNPETPENPREPVSGKPEPKVEEPKKEEGKPPPGYVPHAALHEARLEAREARERALKMEARFEEVLKRISPQDQPKPINIDEDPIGAVKNIDRELNEFRQWKATQEKQAQEYNARQSVMAQYSNMAVQYAQTAKDFPEAYNHWLRSLGEELQDLGYTDWQAQIENMEFNIVQKALQEGANPAERIYAVAKRRGFKAPPRIEQPRDDRGRFEQLQKGQSAAKSLSNPSGEHEPPLTLQALAEMDDEDFDRNWDKVMKATR